MTPEEKIQIYEILTNNSFNITMKLKEILRIFPNYLTHPAEKKTIYEKIEGIFHDGLGTYFELLVYDCTVKYYHLAQELSDKTEVIKKLQLGIDLYSIFFKNNEYKKNYAQEKKNIELGAEKAMEKIISLIQNKTVTSVRSSAQDFRNGNARDIVITLTSWEEINFSLKTDKSWKVAISEGQTPLIQEKVYKRYFNLNDQDFNNLKRELFWSQDIEQIKSNYQNIAHLTQRIFILQLGLQGAEVNNMGKGKITNIKNLKYLLKQLKFYERSSDGSILIGVDRLTGALLPNTILDEIDLNNINLNDFSFLPARSRKPNWYGTEPWIKFKNQTFVSFQTKHQRWKHSSQRFGDITIRLKISWN